MELSTTSRLYDDAIAASKLADERLEPRTRADYTGSLRRFSSFCESEGYPNPLQHRFVELPSVLAAYINKLAQANESQWPAEKLRAALAWHFSKPEMLAGGHPHDRWVVDCTPAGQQVALGNPARSPMIAQILVGLSKVKKRARTPNRASPMSLPKLTQMLDFLATDNRFNEIIRLWVSAVCSLWFYGMCRINEVLLMKRSDIQLGMQRMSSESKPKKVNYGCFTIRDRKTDHDPHASRTYYLHQLPREERAAEALTHVSKWFKFAETKLHHKWHRHEYAFPALTKIPRGSVKKRRLQEDSHQDVPASFMKVGVRWTAAMLDNNFTQVLNVVAAAANINETILGDKIWFTSHCFRRGGAQYRFMFAPERRRWSLKLVKWWTGWSPNEQNETIVRYLLDDVLDREESQLGDSLAPDVIDHVQDSYSGEKSQENEVSTPAQCNPNNTKELIMELRAGLLECVRDVVNDVIHGAGPSTPTPTPTSNSIPNSIGDDTSSLVSELPEAKTWRDYVTQYWESNAACHQYRAGVDMLPKERKVHRSRLSRMKIIAEFVREQYQDDLDQFEIDFRSQRGGELTVNTILAEIRKRKNASR